MQDARELEGRSRLVPVRELEAALDGGYGIYGTGSRPKWATLVFAAGSFGADVGAAIVFPVGAAVAAVAVAGGRRRAVLPVVAVPFAMLALLALMLAAPRGLDPQRALAEFLVSTLVAAVASGLFQ